MIELELTSKRGFAYGIESFEALKELKEVAFQKVIHEKVCNVNIWSFDIILPFKNDNKSIDLLKINNLRCIHNKNINFSEIHRLPQEGWQELIDCWSCHNNEFKGMLDLKIKPRKGGILVSNFYLLADKEILPNCCNKKEKIFYNEIFSNFSTNQLIFKFFEEQFDMKNTIILLIKGKKYEIKMMYRCITIRKDINESFKVGFKETVKNNDEDLYIGEYYKEKILEELINNSLEIDYLGYKFSFVVNS